MSFSDALNENNAESITRRRARPEGANKDEMEALRAGIDEVDEEIIGLLDRRARLARRIGEIKQKNGLEAYAPARERAVLNRVAALSAGDFPKEGFEAVFREIISSSISLEARLKVASLERVRVVCSHPMALSQAATWLRRELPGARLEEVESTGEAARRAAKETGTAAVGSALAAEAHGLNVLARNIQDARTNATRFIVLGRRWAERTGKDKTSVVFSVKDRPGVLRDALSAFAEENINLTRIESRPSRKRAWTYVFFADFRGHPEEERVKRALAALEEHCPYVSLIGAYPEVTSEVFG
jgi:prephenate dehydratase